MSIGARTHRRRRRLTKADKKRLIILGTAAMAVIVFIVLSIITAVMVHRRTLAYQITEISNDDILKANIANAEKLMIVAHPDDESIWGGGHLIDDGGYLVVCVTNGRNDERRDEFIKAVKASGNAPMILEYPDKINGKRDDWSQVRGHIESDIRLLTGYKKWKQIVTHNPKGEYGHVHHQMLNQIVTNSCKDNGMEDNLWYFGEYYTKSKLPEASSGLTELPKETVELKNKLLDFYKTQAKCVDKFRHMAPYENWTKAK